jgi:hypothetical protein
MNWSNKIIGTAAIEEHQFCNFFGAQNEIMLKVWSMLGEGSLRPKNSEPKHLLWATH